MERFKVIKLGDGVGFKFLDRNLVQTFQRQLIGFSNLNANFNKFPGALPVALTCKNINLLRGANYDANTVFNIKNDGNHEVFQLPNGKKRRDEFSLAPKVSQYYVTRKSDGIRYQLMFHCRDPVKHKDYHQTIFNRKMEAIGIKFEVPDHFYQGTVLDGELVKEPDGSHAYYIFDIIALNGYTVTIRNLDDRLLLIKSLLPFIRPCPNTKESPFVLKTKRFEPVHQLETFLKEEKLEYLMTDGKENKDEKHPCDGLCFIEREEGVVTGTATRQLKWKKPQLCTIDVLVKCLYTANVVELYIKNDTQLELWKIQKFDDTRLSDKSDNIDMYNNKIVECFKLSDNWKIKSIRSDKTIPNYIKTVEDTCQSIKDNITIQDIVNVVAPRKKISHVY